MPVVQTTTPNTTTTTTTGTSGTSTTGNNTTNIPTNSSAVITAQPSASSATASGTPTPGQTSGVSLSGTSTGDAFSGTSRGNAPAVGIAAVNGTPANVAVTSNGVPINATLTSNGAAGFPVILDNGTVAMATGFPANGATVNGVTVNGDRVANPAGIAASDLGGTQFAETMPQVGVATSATITAVQNDPSVRKELQKRRSLGRNQQLLNSIAPRTNANLGWQMKDDPISPALHPPS
jgi:hypothetical protein